MKAYLLVFDRSQIPRSIMADTIDRSDIENWNAFFENAICFASKKDAHSLSQQIRAEIPEQRFIITEVEAGKKAGWLPRSIWAFLNRPAPVGADPMLKARVIPCLDVKDGRVVKGVNFVNLRDAGDPVESAVAYDRAGADELCFLDITASHEDRGILLDVVRRTAEVCFMPLTVGGGIRTPDDIRKLLLAGADKASINSAAVADRQFVRAAAEKFGSQCVVVAIDAKRVSAAGRPPMGNLHPWRAAADRNRRGRLCARGCRARGGRDPAHLDGPRRFEDRLRPRTHPRDRRRRADPGDRFGRRRQPGTSRRRRNEGHASAVLAASIFHFGEFTIREAKVRMAAAGIPVRMD